MVLTTHYLEEAQALCNQIAIINHGEVVACESTPDLLARIDEKRIVIRPAVALSTVPASLSSRGAVLRDDGELALVYNPDVDSMAALLADITAAGIEIADLTTEEAALEDVFLQLTSGK